MSMIKSDGTLFVIERLIDKEYGGQLNQFVQDLQAEQDNVQIKIKRVLIEGGSFESAALVQLLRFLNSSGQGRCLRNLSIGNIKFDRALRNVVFDEVLPNLYSLDLFNLKCVDGVSEKKLFEYLIPGIQADSWNSTLMRLRISHMDLSE